MQVDAKRPNSQVERAVRAVTSHMRQHQLKVGDSLPGEAFFADELGVSRAVMREAFGALGALKLIDVANGRRARVGAIDGSVIATSLEHAMNTAQISIMEVWDVRQTIELRTARLAAEARTPDEAAEILWLSEKLAANTGNLDQTTRDDIALHLAIARASHNNLFVQIVASFSQLMEIAVPAAWRTRKTEAQRRTMIEAHRNLARAISAGDPDRAAAAMREHFDSSIGDVFAAVSGK